MFYGAGVVGYHGFVVYVPAINKEGFVGVPLGLLVWCWFLVLWFGCVWVFWYFLPFSWMCLVREDGLCAIPGLGLVAFVGVLVICGGIYSS